MKYCTVCRRVEPGTWPHTHLVDCIPLNESVSHGTLRDLDLIPKFEDVLKAIDPVTFGALNSRWSQQPGDSEDNAEYVVDLIDALNEAAPEGYYFGTIEGDGSDFGFWEINDQD
jgi:hypothetical protein